jgi:hypothetical protein
MSLEANEARCGMKSRAVQRERPSPVEAVKVIMNDRI